MNKFEAPIPERYNSFSLQKPDVDEERIANIYVSEEQFEALRQPASPPLTWVTFGEPDETERANIDEISKSLTVLFGQDETPQQRVQRILSPEQLEEFLNATEQNKTIALRKKEE